MNLHNRHGVILNYTVRNAEEREFEEIGKLMVAVYSQLEGFPKPSEQPEILRRANSGRYE